MKTRWFLLVSVGSAYISLVAVVADWPQWRGPRRDGISQETGLLKEWPREGPKLLWQLKDIGEGYATPAVVGTRLYLLSNRGLDNEFVQALSVQDGKQVWSTRLGKVGNPDQQPPYPMARSTPTLDGDLLYALSSGGDLTPEAYREKGRFTPPDQPKHSAREMAWAYPVVANGRLYIRDLGTLWCYDVKDPKAAK